MKKSLLITILLMFSLLTFGQHPTNLASTNITASSAELSWDASICAGNVNFKYRETGTGSAGWTQTNNVTSPYNLNGLSSSISYDWQVKCAGTGGWSSTAVFVTNSPCILTSSTVITDASCDNTFDGSVILNISGGNGIYSYSWSNGVTTQNLIGVSSGTYIVNITDNNGCTGTDTAIINFIGNKSINQNISAFIDTANPNFPGVVTAYHQWAYDTLTIINTGCDVNIRPQFIINHQQTIANSSIVIKYLFAPPSPQFPNGVWSNIPYSINAAGDAHGYFAPQGDTTGILLGFGAAYQVVIKVKFVSPANFGLYQATWETFEVDNLGNPIQSLVNPSTVSLNLINCSTFSIDSISSTNPSCSSGSDGSAMINTISNGSGTYSYSWSSGQTTNAANNLSAGSYSCIVTDNNWGCTDTANFTINDPNSLTVSLTGTQINCNGANDGTLTTLSTGGSGNFDYIWSPTLPEALPNQSNLPPNTYTVTVVDLVCGGSASASFTISEPPAFTQTTTFVNNLSCDSLICNGSININVSGGTPPYSYNWANGDTVSSKNNLCSGNYSITITDSNGCGPLTENITIIDDPSTPSVNSININNSSCDTTICNGSITLSPIGSTQPYTYLWSNGTNNASASSLCGGNYSVTITDTNNCISVENITISDSISSLDIGLSSTNTSCYGGSNGSAIATISTGGSGGGSGNISTLAYCSSGPAFSDYSNIELVRLIGNGDSISNNTAGICDTYDNFTSQYTTVTPGQTYTLQVNLGTCNSGGFAFIDFAKVFIDWNIDGDFDDPGEEVGSIDTSITPSTNTLNITVPNIGVFGPTRMRVVCQYNSPALASYDVNAIIGPCDTSVAFSPPWYGATEDYSIVVSGSIPATYSWSNGDTTAQINNLTAGTYICTVTDTNGCFNTDSIIITEPSQIIATVNSTNVLCYGESNGTVALAISGGTAGYNTNWGSIDTNALASGTYTYLITDNNGCLFSDSIVINEPMQLSNTYTFLDASCSNSSDGSIDISPIGGTPPYSFAWNNGSNSEDLSNITAGLYSVIITDVNNCIYFDTITINEPTIISVNQNITDVSCFGGNTGSVTINISGGTTDYTLSAFGQTFPLVGGLNNFSAPNIPAGIYPYSIIDANSCIFQDTIIISQPDSIITSATTTNVSCNGLSDGSVSLTISGGAPVFNENWNGANPLALSAGYHSFTITDNNNCSVTDSVLILEPAVLSTSISQINISCYGNSDGNIDLTVSGGTNPYTYLWFSSIQGWTGDTTQNINNLDEGWYTCIITDNNGCDSTLLFNLTEPPPITTQSSSTDVLCNGDSTGTTILTINGGTAPYTENWFGSNPLSLTAGSWIFEIADNNGCLYMDSISISEPDAIITQLTKSDVTSCLINNGSIDLTILGGTPPYSYLWNTNDTTQNLTNLSAGNYIISITDSNGCISEDSINITQPSNGLTLSLTSSSYNGYNISCYNANNGLITANTAGGLGDISYLWSTNDTSSSINGLDIGNYIVTVTDSVGCSLTDSIHLNQPNNLSSIYNTTDVLCNGDSTGSATVIFSGGVTDYLLTWDTYTYPLINGSNIFITPIGVPAGIYPYSVIDLNGCTHSDTIIITEPDEISINLTTSNYNGYNISCNGLADGTLDIIVNGGITPYTHFINGQTANWISTNLVAGIYTDSIIDSAGCTFTQIITLTEPAILSVSLSNTDATCYNECNGLINTQMNGGVGPYNYTWTHDTTITSDTISNLCAGSYNLEITDQNNCQISDSISINEPNQIIVLLDSIQDVSYYGGNDGNIQTSVNGNINGYTFNWIGPAGFSASTANIYNLTAGIYLLTSTDSTGCSVLDTFIVEQPPSLNAILDSNTSLTCNGICTGSIHITPSGGDSTYSYLWLGPNGFISTDEDIDSLCAGTYMLYLSDTSDTIIQTYVISEPSQVSLVVTADTADCYAGNSLASAYPFGGTYPYQISWSNGSTNTSTVLAVGMHYVTITDTNNCTKIDSINILQPDSISINATITDISCYGLQDGIVNLSVLSGGTAPFQYSNNNGVNFQTNNTFYNVGVGLNTLLIIDSEGCTNEVIVSVNEPDPINIFINSVNTSCYGTCDGSATTIVNGGTPPFAINWGTGVDTNALCAGFYNLIVNDVNGCSSTSSITINEPSPLIVNIWQNGSVLEADTGFSNYQWIDNQGNPITGSNSQSFTPQTQGEYSVIVTDSNGCTAESNRILFLIDIISDNRSELNIYPNPSTDLIYIESSFKVTKLRIVDIKGNLLLEKEYITIKTNTSEKIDLSIYPRGIYFIELMINNQWINNKIILQ